MLFSTREYSIRALLAGKSMTEPNERRGTPLIYTKPRWLVTERGEKGVGEQGWSKTE